MVTSTPKLYHFLSLFLLRIFLSLFDEKYTQFFPSFQTFTFLFLFTLLSAYFLFFFPNSLSFFLVRKVQSFRLIISLHIFTSMILGDNIGKHLSLRKLNSFKNCLILFIRKVPSLYSTSVNDQIENNDFRKSL